MITKYTVFEDLTVCDNVLIAADIKLTFVIVFSFFFVCIAHVYCIDVWSCLSFSWIIALAVWRHYKLAAVAATRARTVTGGAGYGRPKKETDVKSFRNVILSGHYFFFILHLSRFFFHRFARIVVLWIKTKSY